MPLLQDLLEACYLLAHPEAKAAPCEFDWTRVSTANLRELEAARKRKRKSGRASRARRNAAQQRFRERQKARIGEAQFNARHADEQSAWLRSENGQRYEARQVDLSHTAARKAAERSKRLGEKLAALALADLEAPTYVVVGRDGRATREDWPLRDATAAWLAQATAPPPVSKPAEISTAVSISLDTNPPNQL